MGIAKKQSQSSMDKLREEAEREAMAEVQEKLADTKKSTIDELPFLQDEPESQEVPEEVAFKQTTNKKTSKKESKEVTKSTKPAPVTKQSAKPTAKKSSKIEVSESAKADIRKKLNETAKLDAVAKSFKVDVSRYAKLSGGLRKMSVVNATLGAAVRAIANGELGVKEAIAKVK